jgi:hypothetical protein
MKRQRTLYLIRLLVTPDQSTIQRISYPIKNIEKNKIIISSGIININNLNKTECHVLSSKRVLITAYCYPKDEKGVNTTLKTIAKNFLDITENQCIRCLDSLKRTSNEIDNKKL